MADELFEVPLFPLDVVLFPGMALPLHIFEPRYRQMIADCIYDHAPFGIVLALPGCEFEREVPAKVGTLARISDYERLPDGRYNVLAIGTRRFGIVDQHRQRPYLTGRVRPLRDREEPEAELPNLVQEARGTLQEYLRTVLEIVGSEGLDITIPTEPEDLSYLIGMCLMCEECEKESLLEMTSVTGRLASGTRMLRSEMELLRQQDQGEEPPRSGHC